MNTEQFISTFEQYIASHELIYRNDRLLVAVSGGIDSVVLAHLLHHCGHDIAIGHCNFKLRVAADEDERFVEELASKLGVPFYSTSFDTEAYAKEHSLSLQMAARALRYAWLEQILAEKGFQRIAVAHQLNDQAETVLLNLAKGTGISGLRGMLPHRDSIIRPLLFTGRHDIEIFARKKGISFRADESNVSTKYERNFIRHELIPVLEQLNPAFIAGLQRTLNNVGYAEQLYKERFAIYKKRLLELREDAIYIPLRKLKTYPYPEHLLFDLLSDYGFNFDQIKAAVSMGIAESGQTFDSGEWRLLKDRHLLILSPLDTERSDRIYVEKKRCTINLKSAKLEVDFIDRPRKPTIPPKPTEAWVDADKLEFPLVLRPWKKGDYFYPLGMTKPHSDKVGKKKLSDLFTDLKMSRLEKEKCWILQSGRKIVWVAGIRLDERFKITHKTHKIAKFRLQHY